LTGSHTLEKRWDLRTDSTDTTVYSPYFSLCLLLGFYSIPGYVKCQSEENGRSYTSFSFSPARLPNSIVQSSWRSVSVQRKGLVVSGICEPFIEEFVEDARYVPIRRHADRQTDVVLYGFHRSSCSGDEELKLGRWGVEVVMKE
jgi:hypothetical protein